LRSFAAEQLLTRRQRSNLAHFPAPIVPKLCPYFVRIACNDKGMKQTAHSRLHLKCINSLMTSPSMILPLLCVSLRSSASLRFIFGSVRFLAPLEFQLTLTLPVTYGNSR